MIELAEHTIEFLGNLPPDVFVGALLLTFVIALTTAGSYRWLSGRRPDALMLLVGLVLLANLASALAAVGFAQSTVPTIRLVERRGRPPRDRIVNLYDNFARPDAPVESR